MYRHWYGPLLGQTVSHIWSSYARCLFIEFGKLTEGEWFVDRKGQRRQYQRMLADLDGKLAGVDASG